MLPKPILPILEKAKEFLDYDLETGAFTWKKAPPRKPSLLDKVAGRCRNGYRAIKINQEIYLGHRLAWAWVHGEEPPAVVDHVNRDKTDNRIENLRDGTDGVNELNARPDYDSPFRVSGVRSTSKPGKFQAYMNRLGRFTALYHGPDFFEAVCARKSAECRRWAAV